MKEEDYTIGNYKIEKTIGSGTFGKVKQGTHLPTLEKVAIKLLDKDKISQMEDIERVRREIKFLKSLNCPNVIRLFEIMEDHKTIYLVMEYAGGGELFNHIVKKRRLNEYEASFFFYQLIEGLESIHAKNIVHRDLKPENLLFNENKQLKIIDFGLSNSFSEGSSLLATPCGSPCYAAPEMVLGNKYSGIKTDIWSTGIILFAMTAGYLPFEDQNNEKLFKKIVKCELEFPNYVSKNSVEMIKLILDTNPATRLNLKDIKMHSFYQQGKSLYYKHMRNRYDEMYGNFNNSFTNSLGDRATNKDFFFQLRTQCELLVNKFTIEKMIKELKFNKDEILSNLENNKHNNITSTYYLLISKYLRDIYLLEVLFEKEDKKPKLSSSQLFSKSSNESLGERESREKIDSSNFQSRKLSEVQEGKMPVSSRFVSKGDKIVIPIKINIQERDSDSTSKEKNYFSNGKISDQLNFDYKNSDLSSISKLKETLNAYNTSITDEDAQNSINKFSYNKFLNQNKTAREENDSLSITKENSSVMKLSNVISPSSKFKPVSNTKVTNKPKEYDYQAVLTQPSNLKDNNLVNHKYVNTEIPENILINSNESKLGSNFTKFSKQKGKGINLSLISTDKDKLNLKLSQNSKIVYKDKLDNTIDSKQKLSIKNNIIINNNNNYTITAENLSNNYNSNAISPNNRNIYELYQNKNYPQEYNSNSKVENINLINNNKYVKNIIGNFSISNKEKERLKGRSKISLLLPGDYSDAVQSSNVSPTNINRVKNITVNNYDKNFSPKTTIQSNQLNYQTNKNSLIVSNLNDHQHNKKSNHENINSVNYSSNIKIDDQKKIKEGSISNPQNLFNNNKLDNKLNELRVKFNFSNNNNKIFSESQLNNLISKNNYETNDKKKIVISPKSIKPFNTNSGNGSYVVPDQTSHTSNYQYMNTNEDKFDNNNLETNSNKLNLKLNNNSKSKDVQFNLSNKGNLLNLNNNYMKTNNPHSTTNQNQKKNDDTITFNYQTVLTESSASQYKNLKSQVNNKSPVVNNLNSSNLFNTQINSKNKFTANNKPNVYNNNSGINNNPNTSTTMNNLHFSNNTSNNFNGSKNNFYSKNVTSPNNEPQKLVSTNNTIVSKQYSSNSNKQHNITPRSMNASVIYNKNNQDSSRYKTITDNSKLNSIINNSNKQTSIMTISTDVPSTKVLENKLFVNNTGVNTRSGNSNNKINQSSLNKSNYKPNNSNLYPSQNFKSQQSIHELDNKIASIKAKIVKSKK
jgi:serine/threonine protein kinase